ncbi:hypothetical protein [Streptomyces venezuelae]|uniref:hypothetical protein n=1 Tax=Streptomyces venezuelae TaxID=54571 RepID=UPI001CC25445|nr:hypothetical protein [Streptomyces venezuelae]
MSRRHAARPTFALTALAALALVACGTEKSGAESPQDKSADAAGVRSGAAFTDMMRKVARSCPDSTSSERPPTGPARTVPSGPAETSPSDTPKTPPTDAIEPALPTAGPEVELNARDWCASALHEERITQALWDLADPTPAKVRTILHDLGYIDERIHDLRRSGTTTRFSLDLRDRGGQLCLDGTAAGEKTVVDKCGAPSGT